MLIKWQLSIDLLLGFDFFIKAHPVDIIKWNLKGKDHVYLRIQATFSVPSFKGCWSKGAALDNFL